MDRHFREAPLPDNLPVIPANAIQPALSDEDAAIPAEIPGLEGLVNHIRKCIR